MRLTFRRMNVLSGMRQTMRLIGNKKAPKHAERSICAKAGSPVGRESYGDGTLIVSGRKYNGALPPVKEQPSKEGQSVPIDAGTQGRQMEFQTRKGMRNAGRQHDLRNSS